MIAPIRFTRYTNCWMPVIPPKDKESTAEERYAKIVKVLKLKETFKYWLICQQIRRIAILIKYPELFKRAQPIDDIAV